MSEIIRTKSGKPFETEKAALLRHGQLRKEGIDSKIIEEKDGWALEVTARRRPGRLKLGARDVLKYPARPGYFRKVFNDMDDNIQRRIEDGYAIVQDSDIQSGDRIAGRDSQMGTPASKNVGGGVKGVLMEIPMEWYEERQKAKQDKITADELAMRRNKADVEGSYGDLKIGTG